MTPSVTSQLEFRKNTGLPLQVRGKNFRKVNKKEEQENKGRTVTGLFENAGRSGNASKPTAWDGRVGLVHTVTSQTARDQPQYPTPNYCIYLCACSSDCVYMNVYVQMSVPVCVWGPESVRSLESGAFVGHLTGYTSARIQMPITTTVQVLK